MVRLKFLLIYYILTSLVISSHWFVSGDNPPAMVLPDETIHGTRRHHFEVHDLADVAGGKWKAVHIPDEDISSMLKIANEKNKTKYTSDIEHEDPSENIDELGVVKLPAEVHGRVHPFAVHASSNKSKNSSRPVGKLIVAMENGERGIKAPPHPVVPKEIELRGYMKEEKPKSRQLHPAKILPRPSLVVAKIPDEDDDSDDDLPLEKVPDPIVAPLRKTSLRTKAGAMRSKILATVIPSSGTSSPKPVTTAADSGQVAMKTGISTKASDKDISNKNPEILAKIKSLLLKSHHLSTNAPVKLTSAGKSEGKPLTLIPEKETAPTHQNVNGLFPLKPNIGPDAFSNHANALNRITSTRKEALLVGIIRALLAQNKLKSGNPNEMSTNILPHYNRQAVLQGIQSLQMKKTFANSQNDAAPARVDTGDPASTQNLDELYKNQRDEELRQELARANEESAEARKMGQQESLTLSNYDRFLNPESRTNWGNMSPEQSKTGDGQVISTLGPQQLNMVQDNATT